MENLRVNELRIGNHIRYRNEIIEVQATDILSAELSPSDFSFIPITEEWLLKFGFIKNDWYNGKHFVLNKYCSIIIEKSGYDKGVWYLGDKSDAYCHRLKKIQFIHELQNLYFALTGEELLIK